LAVCVGGWLRAFAAEHLDLVVDATMERVNVTYWKDESEVPHC